MGGCLSNDDGTIWGIPFTDSSRPWQLFGRQPPPPSPLSRDPPPQDHPLPLPPSPLSPPPFYSFPRKTTIKDDSNAIQGIPFDDVRDSYTLEKLLGKSGFGPTFLCIEKSTAQKCVCKVIFKDNLDEQSDRDDVKRDVENRRSLSGQPNIVEFKAAYQDRYAVFIVMELCNGGDLFQMVSAEGQYTERVIASIIRDIVKAVQVCHNMNVMHRDIKPDNFLLSSTDEGAALKAIDFRRSIVMEQGKEYSDPVKTSCYAAPEGLEGSYGKEIDIWSAGVILYMLISGEAPFYAETDEELSKAIKKGEINLDSQPWLSVSNGAKELVRMMLTVNPQQRISPQQVLDHPWISGGEASDNPMDSALLTKLKDFIANLKKSAK